MTRRELETWVASSRDRLAARGVSVLFGFGPSISRRDAGASWASFTSPLGSGRLIRAPDGSSRLDVYAFADGRCLAEERRAETVVEQLERIAGLLTRPVRVR